MEKGKKKVQKELRAKGEKGKVALIFYNGIVLQLDSILDRQNMLNKTQVQVHNFFYDWKKSETAFQSCFSI